MSGKLQIRRGLKSQLPTLSSGELGLATDTKEVFVGNTTNIQLVTTPSLTIPWIAPTLLNSWVNFGGSNTTAGYYKDQLGIVHLKGLIKSGTIGQIAFTLPSGYRPATQLTQIVGSSNGAETFGRIQIDNLGNVTALVGGNTFFALDFISFLAEQ